VVDGVAESGRLFVLRGGLGTRTVNADVASADRLARIAGPAAGGRFGAALLALAPAGAPGPGGLAVSALHADGGSWPATGGIYVFSGADLAGGADVTAARFIPGDAPNMHLGAFLAAPSGGRSLAAGAPTEDADTGDVRLFDLSAIR
jgi:hypothetical protein